jgi:hypothetical protein
MKRIYKGFYTKKEYFPYSEYLNRVNSVEELKKKGVIFLYKRSIIRCIIGGFIVGGGIITLPIPTGSIFLISYGLYLMGFSVGKFYKSLKLSYKYYKSRREWVK